MGNQIAEIRASKGLTQDQLAEALGFSGTGRRMIIQRWELDHRSPSVENINKLTRVLGCSYEDLKLGVP